MARTAPILNVAAHGAPVDGFAPRTRRAGRRPILWLVTSTADRRREGELQQDGHRPPETIRLQATRGFGRVLAPRELWRYRELALQIAARDITVRYRQTALGAIWAVLQPAASVVIFTLVFSRLAHVSSGHSSYPLFALAGLVAWTFFANALLLASDSLVANAPLVAKIYFPRIFIISGVLAAGLVDLAIATLILLVVVPASGTALTPRVLALPLFVAIELAATLGISSALAAANVRFRDIRYVVPFAVQTWLFVTPVAYPITVLHEPWRWIVTAINPMVGVVEGFRWALLGTDTRPHGIVLLSAAAALLILVGGAFYFRRMEKVFADLV
jgi:lipopolysaccharide transport system permease protein